VAQQPPGRQAVRARRPGLRLDVVRAHELDGQVLLFDRDTGITILVDNDTTRAQYLDPRIHDIETAQLMCKPCGGLYDVAPFLTPAG
jgi:hypothetical protein